MPCVLFSRLTFILRRRIPTQLFIADWYTGHRQRVHQPRWFDTAARSALQGRRRGCLQGQGDNRGKGTGRDLGAKDDVEHITCLLPGDGRR
jgi:hypothetical protein